MSIPMIAAHKRKGHGTHFIVPISGLLCHLAGGVFVDDTNLIHIYMRQVETALEVHARLQESVIDWGKLLMATGGALKLAKCYFYLLSLHWKAGRTWVYESNKVNPALTIGVQILDGSLEELKHHLLNKVITTLALMTCPSGSIAAALDRMQQQGQEWVDKVLASMLCC
jgi:hypothetical protein